MGSRRITSQRVTAALIPLLDEDISAVQREEDMAVEEAEIDRLIEDVERHLAEAPLHTVATGGEVA